HNPTTTDIYTLSLHDALPILPAPLFGAELRSELQPRAGHTFPYADLRFTPHYPSKTPLDNVFRQVIPGGDEFVTEKYVFELMPRSEEHTSELQSRGHLVCRLL